MSVKTNKTEELTESYNGKYKETVRKIRQQRIKWLGHVRNQKDQQ